MAQKYTKHTQLLPLRLSNEQRSAILTQSCSEFGLAREILILGSCDARHEISHRLKYDRSSSSRGVFISILLDALQGDTYRFLSLNLFCFYISTYSESIFVTYKVVPPCRDRQFRFRYLQIY
jgi:hypothetical protein